MYEDEQFIWGSDSGCAAAYGSFVTINALWRMGRPCVHRLCQVFLTIKRSTSNHISRNMIPHLHRCTSYIALVRPFFGTWAIEDNRADVQCMSSVLMVVQRRVTAFTSHDDKPLPVYRAAPGGCYHIT